MPVQGRIEYVADQRRLSGTGDSGDHGERPEREAHVYVLEVVLHRALHHYGILPVALLPVIAAALAGEILEGYGVLHGFRRQLAAEFPGEDDLPSGAACKRPHIDQQVGGAHDLLVVLDDYHRVAYVAQAPQDPDQLLRVAGMQADAGFVEYVHRAHQAGAERGHQVDALALAARKRVAGAAQRQVRQPDVADALQARHYLGKRLGGHLPLGGVELQVAEKRQSLVDVHREQLVDVLFAHADPEGLLAQAASPAGAAFGASAEAAEHVLVLYLVALGLHPVEEFLDSHYGILVAFDGMSVPDGFLHLFGKVAPGFEDRDAVAVGHLDQMVPEPAHLLAAPAGYGPVVDALRLVGNHQVLADVYDLSEAAADRTGAKRRIEAEKIFVGLAEHDAVEFETAAEPPEAAVLRRHGHVAASPRECVGDRRQQAGAGVGVHPAAFRKAHAVHQQPGVGRIVAVRLQHLVDTARLPVGIETVVSVFLEAQHQLHLVVARGPAEVGQHVAGAASAFQPSHHVVDRVLMNLFAGNRRESMADPGEDEAQVVVDLRGGGDRGARVPGGHLLLYGYGGRNALYRVHVGFGHAAEELARV